MNRPGPDYPDVSCRRDSDRRAFRWLLWPAVVTFVGLFVAVYSDKSITGHFSDSIRYLFLADIFNPTVEATSLATYLGLRSVFPPGYPMSLGLLGAGTESVVLAHQLTALHLLLAAVISFHYYQQRQVPPLPALFLTCLFVYAYPTLLHSLFVASEFLYCALTMASFATFKGPDSRPKHLLLAAGLASMAALTRSVGVVLILVLALALLPRPRKAAVFLLVSITPSLAWAAYKALAVGAVTYTDWAAAYLDGRDPIAVGSDIIDRMLVTGEAFLEYFAYPGSFLATTLITTALMACALCGLVSRFRQLKPEAAYLAGYLGAIILWPFSSEAERFVIPIMPLVLLFAWYGMCDIGRFRRSAYVVVAFFFLSLIVPSGGFIGSRMLEPVPNVLVPYKRSHIWWMIQDEAHARQTLEGLHRLILASTAIEENVPPDQCIYSTLPELVHFYGKRFSFTPPEPHRFRSAALPCRYVFLTAWRTKQDQYPPMYPYQHIKPLVEPVFVSYSGESGNRAVEAALVRIKDITQTGPSHGPNDLDNTGEPLQGGGRMAFERSPGQQHASTP